MVNLFWYQCVAVVVIVGFVGVFTLLLTVMYHKLLRRWNIPNVFLSDAQKWDGGYDDVDGPSIRPLAVIGDNYG
jgi:hypothetical protein